jgi:hypothetical protein
MAWMMSQFDRKVSFGIFWARPENDAVDRSDHRKLITPDCNGRGLMMMQEAAQKMKGVW